jgi:hypothetical protein
LLASGWSGGSSIQVLDRAARKVDYGKQRLMENTYESL